MFACVPFFLVVCANYKILKDKYLVHTMLFNHSKCLAKNHKGNEMFKFLLYVSIFLQ